MSASFRHVGLAICGALLIAPAIGHAQTLVVFGNTLDGGLVARSDARNPGIAEITKQVQAIRPDGWVLLLATNEAGYGAATCVRDGSQIRFEVAHGLPTARDAVRAADEKMRPIAKSLAATFFSCGPSWRTLGTPNVPRERSVVDTVVDGVKVELREEVRCEPTQSADEQAAAATLRKPDERPKTRPAQENPEGKKEETCPTDTTSIGIRG